MLDVRRRKDIRVCEPRSVGNLQKLEKQGLLITSATPRGRLRPNRSGQRCPGDEHRTGHKPQDLNSHNDSRAPSPRPTPPVAAAVESTDRYAFTFSFGNSNQRRLLNNPVASTNQRFTGSGPDAPHSGVCKDISSFVSMECSLRAQLCTEVQVCKRRKRVLPSVSDRPAEKQSGVG